MAGTGSTTRMTSWVTALDQLAGCSSETIVRVWDEGVGVRDVKGISAVLEGAGRVGLVTNQAVCTSRFETCAEVVYRACKASKDCQLVCILGPQHGFYQTEQDNMIETPDLEFRFDSDGHRVPLFSLYSKTREPTSEHVQHFDTFVIDLVDVGCRIYTYMLTMAGCLRAAASSKKKVIVLDRPNPLGLSYNEENGDGISWRRVEGNLLNPTELHSFVGYYAIPLRHGLTMGELARLFVKEDNLSVDLRVVCVSAGGGGGDGDKGIVSSYDRRTSFDAEWFRARWVLPSPNLPSWDTCFFFPASVTLEGTNVSEGRGTTSPFQIIGAPYLDSDAFISHISDLQRSEKGTKRHNSVEGITVRKHLFRPTFNKHKDVECRGVSFHALEHEKVNLFALGQHFLYSTMAKHSTQFQYKQPPYEYNHTDLPLLLIVGDKRWKRFYDAVLRVIPCLFFSFFFQSLSR
eukprot:TRINITY_DN6228_c0_g1_i1.p1 TRINITY_DN6228_c0_g1~~TRINITY_DN6228_c0_g1_i1.p1  ORF type:complete len:470 (+),score=66.74 TRINITY_DN6228_c0_g1_i1:31-1410(+)